MIDDRRAAILRAVVQCYIETSQPVSSSMVVAAENLSASSATVRNDMAVLERDGFLRQPHTSAGRVPTDQGYRFFVDNLSGPVTLGPTQQHDVKALFERATGEIEQMLHEAGALLSNLTGSAAVIVGPDHERKQICSAQVVPVSTHTALTVVIYSDGSVEKHSIEIDEDDNAAIVAEASEILFTRLSGKSDVNSSEQPKPAASSRVDALVDKAVAAITGEQRRDEEIYVGGASRLALAFDAIETVRSVLTILEQQYVVVTLIRSLLDSGISVSIGSENKLAPLEQCSLVVAPMVVDNEQRGSVAVLGPTRMDYAQAMAAVTVVGRKLGERLGENGN